MFPVFNYLFWPWRGVRRSDSFLLHLTRDILYGTDQELVVSFM